MHLAVEVVWYDISSAVFPKCQQINKNETVSLSFLMTHPFEVINVPVDGLEPTHRDQYIRSYVMWLELSPFY